VLGRQRRWQSLVDDPQTPFMVGRLIGANEMAVALLAKEDNDTAQRVASVLGGATMFFMEPTRNTKHSGLPPPGLPPPSEADTEIRTPKR
jgi:hypothetical protein